jgi:maleamate amidohydrolase
VWSRYPQKVTAMTEERAEQYATYGQHEVGFGEEPAILVVDFQRGFTEPEFDMGGAPLIERAVGNTVRLLETARTAGVPVVKCVMGYGNRQEQPHWKVSACHDLILGRPECEIDPRVHDPGYDMTIVKNGPSIFFQTPVITYLVRERIDTVIVTGCVTSGCVRASVVDSFQHGFRTLVPEDCVGDHDEGPHRANLRDVERRYADITDAERMIERIESLRRIS